MEEHPVKVARVHEAGPQPASGEARGNAAFGFPARREITSRFPSLKVHSHEKGSRRGLIPQRGRLHGVQREGRSRSGAGLVVTLDHCGPLAASHGCPAVGRTNHPLHSSGCRLLFCVGLLFPGLEPAFRMAVSVLDTQSSASACSAFATLLW